MTKDTGNSPDLKAAIDAADTFIPYFDRVLIKREKSAIERRMEKSGLVTTDQTKDSFKSSEGILIKCADDCDERIKGLTGKRILFARYSGDDIKVLDQEFVLARDVDIFGELK